MIKRKILTILMMITTLTCFSQETAEEQTKAEEVKEEVKIEKSEETKPSEEKTAENEVSTEKQDQVSAEKKDEKSDKDKKEKIEDEKKSEEKKDKLDTKKESKSKKEEKNKKDKKKKEAEKKKSVHESGYDEELYAWVDQFADKEEVVAWREIYLKEKRLERLTSIINNSLEYRLYVRKMVRELELPPELEYLPVVESAYNPSVKSRSGAVGLWQFMANSVKPNLKLGEYIDERLDPWKSTYAGLKKLEYNKNYFDDWFLGLAGYNCGNGKLSKAIKKAKGEKDFWILAEKGFIPKQTADYVPQLIAVCDICIHAEKYGVSIPTHNEEYETMVDVRDGNFDYYETKKPYLIKDLSRELGMTEKDLKKLNPALTKGFTPPAEKYQLRLPLGKGEAAKEAIAKIKPLEFPFKYKVVAGDSLWSISRKYGVTVQAICETNGIQEKAILRLNQILYIPAAK